MKKFKGLALATLSVITMTNALGVFAGCGGDETEKVDPNKTQFYIGNFDGGYGHDWISQAEKMFEERYAGKSFEPGKTGVQIWINNGKDEYQGYQFYTTISGLEQDFFVAPSPREEIINNKLLISVNDIMDESMSEFGDNKTIREKLSDWYTDAYQISKTATAEEEPIYFLPTAEAYFGNIVYDIDLFETKSYFIKDGGGWTNGVANDKSAGMDGVKGTYDDGLPTTEAEFFALLDVIATKGDVPFTWAGQYPAYMNAFVFNMFCNYDDGLGQELYNTLEGEYTFPGETEPTVFNGYNIVDAQRLPGRLASLKVVEKMIKNTDYYSTEAFKSTQSHTEAQDEFLLSVDAETRIAMLIEGTWWESEATDTFNSMAQGDESYAKKTRRLGLMPTIRPDGSTGEKTNFITSAQALFINGNTEHVELAKTFMKFLLSDEIRELFTNVTGCPAPYDYKLSDKTYNNLSVFGKSLWEVHQNKDGLYNFKSEHRTSKAYVADMGNYPYNFQAEVGEELISCPFTYFKFTKGASATNYFQGMQNFAQKKYDDFYKKYVED